MSMALELSDRVLAGWEREAAIIAKSPYAPDHFKEKPDEIVIAYFGLNAIGVRPSVNTLQKTYVIKGKPGYMAQLQIAVAARHGWDVRPVEGRCDGKSATVRIRRARSDEPWEAVTFTWDDAVQAGLPESNPTYKKYPAAMLFARAVTKAIGQYCPGVMLGIDEAADFAATEAATYLDRSPSAPDQALGGKAQADPVGDSIRTPQEPTEISTCYAGVADCTRSDEHKHDTFVEDKAAAARAEDPDNVVSMSSAAWIQKCREAGIRQADFLRKAAEVGQGFGIEVHGFDDVVAPELVAELSDWLSTTKP